MKIGDERRGGGKLVEVVSGVGQGRMSKGRTWNWEMGLDRGCEGACEDGL